MIPLLFAVSLIAATFARSPRQFAGITLGLLGGLFALGAFITFGTH